MVIVTVTKTRQWCAVVVVMLMVLEVESLNGENVCMVQQKYNITKRVKYRAPMSVRTYEWCFSMPPRCSKWKTEMRDLTKLETDERIAEVAVCCPGYKMKDVSCVSICPNGKTGHRCSDDCPRNKWGPNCVNDCEPCMEGTCSPITGVCSCQDGWQGESCEIRMPPSTSTAKTTEDLLTNYATKPTPPIAPAISSMKPALVVTTSTTLLETTPPITSRTTLIENTTYPSTLKSVIETPILVSNRTVLEATSVSSITPLTTSSVPIKALLETPNTTTIEPKTTDMVSSPATTHKTTSSATSDSTSKTTVTTMTPSAVVVTTAAIRVIDMTATEGDKFTPMTEGKQNKEIVTSQTTVITRLKGIEATKKIQINNNTIPTETTIELEKLTKLQNNMTTEINATTENAKIVEEATKRIDSKYNKTEISRVPSRVVQKTMHEIQVPVKVTMDKHDTSKTYTKTFNNLSDVLFTTTVVAAEGTIKVETTKRPQSTIRYFPTTVKFKPKEIWIRPAQKEPEHITAVMEGKGKERTSLDLISVISIAGGIMMAVITVAVIIVMVERCKRPRYEDVRKVSDIRMQVMIDNNDVPPPYVRSIFHTPLPDPPTSEKCHYQPISTLDRNLKQFMRPVVVQTISPIMLENFRGILECHYDHLPQRSHNIDTSQRHFSLAPSVDDVDELTRLRPCSAMDSKIEAMKCEAMLDVIDSTTSEPLYAEIPCWRPPSEHAIEIMNLNGEAVTEL